MVSQRTNFCIEVVDDRLFVVGGYTSFSITYKVQFFDKETDDWQEGYGDSMQRTELLCAVRMTLTYPSTLHP